MPVDATLMGASMFATYVASFPLVSGLTRKNSLAQPPVPTHSPMGEILNAAARGIATNIPTITILAVPFLAPPPPPALSGAGVFAPDPFPAAFSPSPSDTKDILKSSIQAALGWVGPAGQQALDSIVGGVVDYLASNTSITATIPGVSVGVGATTITAVVPPTFIATTADSIITEFEDTGKLYFGDDPSNGVGPTLISMATEFATIASTFLATLSTPMTTTGSGVAPPAYVSVIGRLI